VGNGTTPGLVGTITATATTDALSGTLTIKGATMSYTDGAGRGAEHHRPDQPDGCRVRAEHLNVAISDVAAQDGYIGAQINTLNSISQVMSTQQENVVSAQNAMQATDYASATSNMSKYEILSQTGIAALAQANSVQQEVTKLLQ
jgi:flagellin